MSHLTRALRATVLSAALLVPLASFAQDNAHQAIVSIYRIAPGKQLDFVKWMAAREAVDREAGVPPTQWYAHLDGDSWDYVGISPNTDQATSDKVDALARKHGLKVGMASGLELRTLMASHTDTISAGPFSASELISRLSQP
jgi:hypothetical protein